MGIDRNDRLYPDLEIAAHPDDARIGLPASGPSSPSATKCLIIYPTPHAAMLVAKMRLGADFIHQLLIHEDAATGRRFWFDHGPIIFSQVPLPPFRSAVLVRQVAGHY